MAQPAYRYDASQLLTLEEIGKLTAEGGKPAETLMNVVARGAMGTGPFAILKPS